MTWWIYIARCADDSLYTGITNNLEARLRAHNDGVGAKYTAARRPIEFVYREEAEDRSAAGKREARIKRLRRSEKLRLIRGEG